MCILMKKKIRSEKMRAEITLDFPVLHQRYDMVFIRKNKIDILLLFVQTHCRIIMY